MAVTTELLLARHGEATCNVDGIVGGDRGCTGLTPQGRQQVTHLATRLTREHADRPFDIVYATPRRRVREIDDPPAIIITALADTDAD